MTNKSEQPVLLSIDGEVATLTMNRPAKLNAMNRAIWQGVVDGCAAVAENRDVKVLVVKGATPQAFSAGADIAEFPEVHATAESARAYHALVRQAYDALANLEKPSIALIQGICFGGGCALALCCDLRYADRTARFSIPPARLGIVYSLHETKRLADLVGPSKTKEILMGAKVIDAEEAAVVGLVTRLFDAADVVRETQAFAQTLCELSQFTIRAVKQMVGKITYGETDDNAETRAVVAAGFQGADYREGRDAFLQKRKAEFSYR